MCGNVPLCSTQQTQSITQHKKWTVTHTKHTQNETHVEMVGHRMLRHNVHRPTILSALGACRLGALRVMHCVWCVCVSDVHVYVYACMCIALCPCCRAARDTKCRVRVRAIISTHPHTACVDVCLHIHASIQEHQPSNSNTDKAEHTHQRHKTHLGVVAPCLPIHTSKSTQLR